MSLKDGIAAAERKGSQVDAQLVAANAAKAESEYKVGFELLTYLFYHVCLRTDTTCCAVAKP